jgi:hypothetical protein
MGGDVAAQDFQAAPQYSGGGTSCQNSCHDGETEGGDVAGHDFQTARLQCNHAPLRTRRSSSFVAALLRGPHQGTQAVSLGDPPLGTTPDGTAWTPEVVPRGCETGRGVWGGWGSGGGPSCRNACHVTEGRV